MKINQKNIFAITAVLLLALAGCDNTDGQIKVKAPMKDVSEMTPGKNWSVTDVEGYEE